MAQNGNKLVGNKSVFSHESKEQVCKLKHLENLCSPQVKRDTEQQHAFPHGITVMFLREKQLNEIHSFLKFIILLK